MIIINFVRGIPKLSSYSVVVQGCNKAMHTLTASALFVCTDSFRRGFGRGAGCQEPATGRAGKHCLALQSSRSCCPGQSLHQLSLFFRFNPHAAGRCWTRTHQSTAKPKTLNVECDILREHVGRTDQAFWQRYVLAICTIVPSSVRCYADRRPVHSN